MAVLTETCLPTQLALPANRNAVLAGLKDCTGATLSDGAQVALCADIAAINAALAALPAPTPGTAGQDGKSVTSGTVNATGNLILTMSDGSTIDAGVVKGADGANGLNGTNGLNGKGILAWVVNPDGSQAITYGDGVNPNTVINVPAPAAGADGTNGINGTDGEDGVGLQAHVVNPDGSQVYTYTNGTTVNVPAAPAGNDGNSIQSATVAGSNLVLTMTNGSQVVTSMQPIIDQITAALPVDKFVSSVGAYNPATNLMTMNLNDGTTINIDFTQVITDAVASIGGATDTTSGLVQLNQGTQVGDSANASDALTAAGLAAILNQTGVGTPNALQAAIATLPDAFE